jgi:hypothetical protein
MSDLLCGRRAKASCSDQIRYQNIDILIQIELDEEPGHKFLTRGSISSGGIRFRSI